MCIYTLAETRSVNASIILVALLKYPVAARILPTFLEFPLLGFHLLETSFLEISRSLYCNRVS